MVIRFRSALVVALLAFTLGAGCGDDSGTAENLGEDSAATTSSTATEATATSAPAASVSFAEPADGAKLTSPLKVKMQATGVTIEPAGEVKAGAGHFHITVDGGCVTPGEVIPNDATHLHYGKAQTEAEVPLEAGSHTLCLQVGDGAHTALDLAQTITVEVTAGGTGY
ncbi:MAG: DUF4399 domain-containing protein [Acidimicrobiia bacterium]